MKRINHKIVCSTTTSSLTTLRNEKTEFNIARGLHSTSEDMLSSSLEGMHKKKITFNVIKYTNVGMRGRREGGKLNGRSRYR